MWGVGAMGARRPAAVTTATGGIFDPARVGVGALEPALEQNPAGAQGSEGKDGDEVFEHVFLVTKL